MKLLGSDIQLLLELGRRCRHSGNGAKPCHEREAQAENGNGGEATFKVRHEVHLLTVRCASVCERSCRSSSFLVRKTQCRPHSISSRRHPPNDSSALHTKLSFKLSFNPSSQGVSGELNSRQTDPCPCAYGQVEPLGSTGDVGWLGTCSVQPIS